MADGDSSQTIRYRPTPTAAKFHASQANIRGLRGPVGSGKSVGCVMEIVAQAMQMPPQRDNVRRSRWIAIRNTYPELPAMSSQELTPAYLGSQDCVLISTDHSMYDYDFIVANSRFVLDTRNATKAVKSGRDRIRKA